MRLHPLVGVRDGIIAKNQDRSRDEEYRREVVDLFRDYRHPWDILTELVQNAIDAINENPNIDEGRLVVRVDGEDKKLVVEDNGVGIPPENIKKVLVPNFSFNKSSKKTYGYKGVGLSFVSHLTRKFKIESVSNKKYSKYVLENNIDWILNREPELHESEAGPTATDKDSGTVVTLTLDGDYESVRTLRSLNDFFIWATNKEVLEFVLRTKTAAGNTAKYFGKDPRKEVNVFIEVNNCGEEKIDYSYLSPFSSSFAKDLRYKLDESVDNRKRYTEIFQDSNRRDKDKIYRCLRKDIYGLRVGKQKRTRTNFDLSILVCGESGVSELERDYGIRDLDKSIINSFKMETGIYLSVDGMPTSIQLQNYTGGFTKRFFCLVDVDMNTNDELDKGRKGISEHTKNLIVSSIDQELKKKQIGGKYSIYQAARRMKQSQSRGYAGTDFKKHLDKWDKEPGVIKELSLTKIPLDENACILIFSELLGGGKLGGYEFRYISQDATFDFAFNYRVHKSRLGDHSYSISQGFIDTLDYNLEDQDGLLRGRLGYNWHIGEFKIAAQDIIGKDEQPLDQLDLLVVWDFDTGKLTKGGATILSATVADRKYEGVTHIMRDLVGECQVICLRDLLDELGLLS